MKAYRFFSNPGHIVSDGNTGLPMFKFDENGEYVTLDPALFQRMKPHFRHEEIELAEVKAHIAETEETGGDAQTPCFLCPHCDFEAKTESGLSSHIRAKHKEAD
jgi:hypothetical protein